MSRTAQSAHPPTGAGPGCGSPFDLPDRRRRIGAGAEDPPSRLLTMLVIAFLLASPIITLLLAVQ